MYAHMAWRNIWRNVRRTLVILAAIFIGVWSMILFSALMRGMLVSMLDNGIATLTGHVQIHEKGYHDDPVIEHSMDAPQKITDIVSKNAPASARWTTRVRVNGVAQNARHSAGVSIVGIDPAKEQYVSFFKPSAITHGRFLKQDDAYGIVIGQALVDKVKTKLGHKIVLMSQDTTKQVASRAFKIVGVFQAEMEGTEKGFAFITQKAAQDMLRMNNAISEISILLANDEVQPQLTATIEQDLEAASPGTYEVLTWQQLLPLVNAYLNMFNSMLVLWYVVVFIAMGFGIVNTTLMAVLERIREFGLLKALGMRPIAIVKDVLFESFFIMLLGLVIGNALGLLSAYALSGGIDLSAVAGGAELVGMSRVIYPVLKLQDIVLANGVIFVLGMLVSLYPAIRAARITPVEALAHT